jgi:nuclear-control-of-ATPase protein 2
MGLTADSKHGADLRMFDAETTAPEHRHKWKGTIAKSIALMDAAIQVLNEDGNTSFDTAVSAKTQDDDYYTPHESSGELTAKTAFLQTADVGQRLQGLLSHGLPRYTSRFNAAVKEIGKPSALIRYWLPASILLVRILLMTRLLRPYPNRCHQLPSCASQ